MAGGGIPGHRPGGQGHPHAAARRAHRRRDAARASRTRVRLPPRRRPLRRGHRLARRLVPALPGRGGAAGDRVERRAGARRLRACSRPCCAARAVPAVAAARPAAAATDRGGTRCSGRRCSRSRRSPSCRVPEALLLLRLQDAGVAVAMVPLVWAGLHVVRSASSYPGGWLSDLLGPAGHRGGRRAGVRRRGRRARPVPRTVRGRGHLPGAGPRRRPHRIRRTVHGGPPFPGADRPGLRPVSCTDRRGRPAGRAAVRVALPIGERTRRPGRERGGYGGGGRPAGSARQHGFGRKQPA